MRHSFIVCSAVTLLLLWMKTETALEASKIKNGVGVLMKFYKPCLARRNKTDCFRTKTSALAERVYRTDLTPLLSGLPLVKEKEDEAGFKNESKIDTLRIMDKADAILLRLICKMFRSFPMKMGLGDSTIMGAGRSSQPTGEDKKATENRGGAAKKATKDNSEYNEDTNYTEEDTPEPGHESNEMNYAGEEEDMEMDEPEEEAEEEEEEEVYTGGYAGRPIAMNLGTITMTKPNLETQSNQGHVSPSSSSMNQKKEPMSMMPGMVMPMRPYQSMMPMMGGGGEMLMPLKSGEEGGGGGGGGMMPMMMMMMPSPEGMDMDKPKKGKKKKKKKKKKHKKKEQQMMMDKMDGMGDGGMMMDAGMMMKMGMAGVGGLILIVLKAITLISGKAVLASTIALTLSIIMALKALFNAAHPQQSEDKVMSYVKKPIHINADSGYTDYRNYHGNDGWSMNYDPSYFPTHKSGKLIADVPENEKLKRTEPPLLIGTQTDHITPSKDTPKPFDFNPETYSSANIINYKNRLNGSGIDQFHAHSIPLYAGYSPTNNS